MEQKTYREKLLDPRWQRRRLEILGAADFTCRDCGAKNKTLHVHHVYYISGREPWDYPDNLLRCVCEDCHREHADQDEQLDGELHDLRCMLRQGGLRSKRDATEAIRMLATWVNAHGDRAVIGLHQIQCYAEIDDAQGRQPLPGLFERYAQDADRSEEQIEKLLANADAKKKGSP